MAYIPPSGSGCDMEFPTHAYTPDEGHMVILDFDYGSVDGTVPWNHSWMFLWTFQGS